MDHDTPRFLFRPARALLAALPLVFASPEIAAGDDTLSLSCAICHGTPQAPSRMPDFYALDSQQIRTMLREFRAGTRAGTAMPRLALSLSDAEIETLALRFGGTPP